MSGSRSTPPQGKAPSRGPQAALEAQRTGSAGDTLRRAQWLDAVDQLLRPYLPSGVAAHARLANVRDGRLVFVVDSPTWHAKVRLAAPTLIDAARSVGLEVTGLSVKATASPLRPRSVDAGPRTPISAAARQELATALALLQPTPEDSPGTGRQTGTLRGLS